MKLIIAIVQDEDASRLVSSLMNEGFGVTKLATTGGFLRAGNTTLLVGVEDERFEGAMGVIEKVCKSRKQLATSPTSMAGVSALSHRSHGGWRYRVCVDGGSIRQAVNSREGAARWRSRRTITS